jgi:hypothetical protein
LRSHELVGQRRMRRPGRHELREGGGEHVLRSPGRHRMGHRQVDWEFSTGVQQQILPRVSVEAGYFRRWYGNFGVTDNRSVTASDFDPFCITAPWSIHGCPAAAGTRFAGSTT